MLLQSFNWTSPGIFNVGWMVWLCLSYPRTVKDVRSFGVAVDGCNIKNGLLHHHHHALTISSPVCAGERCACAARGGAALSGAGSARPNVRSVPPTASPVAPPAMLNVAYGLISYISVMKIVPILKYLMARCRTERFFIRSLLSFFSHL